MTSWVVLISAVAGVVGVIVRSALQYVVAIWSLKADERGRRHAIKLLEVLQKDRPTAVDQVRALTRKVSRSGDIPSDTGSHDRV